MEIIQNGKNSLVENKQVYDRQIGSLLDELDSIRSNLSGVNNYDGINTQNAASAIISNINLLRSSCETSVSNLQTYIQATKDFDTDDLKYEDDDYIKID